MADKKISQEDPISGIGGLDGTEQVRLEKGAANNYRASVDELKTFIGGGGATDILLADLQTAYNAGTMTPGWYYITDRKIWVEALNGSSVSPVGKRLMYCPATYAATTDGSGNVWLGVWNSALTPNVADLTIWGGKVWNNETATNALPPVDDFNLDPTEWTLIDVAHATNNEYIELSFGCSFDVVNDWVSKQWDDKGNVHGIDFLEQSTLYSFPENPVDFNDWNFETIGTIYANNKSTACFNNVGAINIYNNIVNGLIKDKVADYFNNPSLPVLESGTFTPTLTNDTNITDSTSFVCQYLRVGNVVTVSGRLLIQPTSNASNTILIMNVPINSAFNAGEQAAGVAHSFTAAGGAISEEATNLVRLTFLSNGTSNANWFFTYTYLIQ